LQRGAVVLLGALRMAGEDRDPGPASFWYEAFMGEISQACSIAVTRGRASWCAGCSEGQWCQALGVAGIGLGGAVRSCSAASKNFLSLYA